MNLLFTEGCFGGFDPAGYQDWSHGEGYGESMINDFNRGTVGWTDWNILLDERGGPNHVENFCFAPVHADTRIGKLIFTPSYYYIGHFSKFIRPGAVRVGAAPSRSHLLATSFLNPDGSMATVVMNRSDAAIDYRVIINGAAVAETLPAHAIQTFVY